MDIRVNIIEVATILADRDLVTSYAEEGWKWRYPNGILSDIGDETSYTEEAQEFFDKRYDYWYDVLWDLRRAEYE
jgi:hypothetical protein